MFCPQIPEQDAEFLPLNEDEDDNVGDSCNDEDEDEDDRGLTTPGPAASSVQTEGDRLGRRSKSPNAAATVSNGSGGLVASILGRSKGKDVGGGCLQTTSIKSP